MFENPFRDGGKLSRDAEDIVIAVKSGKLSVTSQKGALSFGYDEKDLAKNGELSPEEKNYEVSSSLVKPCNRKNAVIENVPSKSENSSTEHKIPKENTKSKGCCAIS